MFDGNKDHLNVAESWLAAGHGVALATVVQTWSSAPRYAGASLVVRDDGDFLGSVSGGCVENEVVASALAVIATGASRMLALKVSDHAASGAGLACGGTIHILVEKILVEKIGGEGGRR